MERNGRLFENILCFRNESYWLLLNLACNKLIVGLLWYTEIHIFVLFIYFLSNLLKRIKDFLGLLTVLLAYLQTWNILVTKISLPSFHIWNTSLLCTRTIGILQRYLKFFHALRMLMTIRIFLNWARVFTFSNCSAIDMMTFTSLFTIRCDERLFDRKCLIVVLTFTGYNRIENFIWIRKWKNKNNLFHGH